MINDRSKRGIYNVYGRSTDRNRGINDQGEAEILIGF